MLLVQRDGPSLPVDEKVKAHLESRGFAVTLQDQSTAPSVAAGADLVVISSTVATMDYESLAPARRVMLFLGNETFTNLSPAGRMLFDAAIDWTAGIR